MKQINIFLEMVISVAVYCKSMEIYGKSDSRQGKFPINENLKQQWFMKIKRRNI